MSKSTAAIGAWLISRARVKRPIRSAAACSSVSPPDGRARQATAPRPSGPSAAWAAEACAHGPETRTALPNGPPGFARAAQTTLPQPRRPDPSSQVTRTLPSPPTATAGSRPPVEPATAVPRPNVPPAGRRETTIGVPERSSSTARQTIAASPRRPTPSATSRVTSERRSEIGCGGANAPPGGRTLTWTAST